MGRVILRFPVVCHKCQKVILAGKPAEKKGFAYYHIKCSKQKEVNMEIVTKTIKQLDSELYKKAKASAVSSDKGLGQWLNEAIKDKLKKEDRKAK